MKITLNRQEITDIVLAYITELGLPLDDKNLSVHQVPENITVVIEKNKAVKESKDKPSKEVKEKTAADESVMPLDEDKPEEDTNTPDDTKTATKALFTASSDVVEEDTPQTDKETKVPRKLFGE